jgi:NAD(P)-dependent dehydrogenase (short-subunit alcohol dehydrogenase family)
VRSYRRTEDGFEATMQGNHLGPFLLTNLLRDRLRGGRVVNTASAAHRTGRVDPADLTGDAARYGMLRWYGASKAANILFAAEAARRWPDIASTAFHPGAVKSNFGAGGAAQAVVNTLMPFLGTTPEGGADTLVWLATTPTADIVPGGYYAKRQLRRPAASASDRLLAGRLWEASAKAVGLVPGRHDHVQRRNR